MLWAPAGMGASGSTRVLFAPTEGALGIGTGARGGADGDGACCGEVAEAVPGAIVAPGPAVDGGFSEMRVLDGATTSVLLTRGGRCGCTSVVRPETDAVPEGVMTSVPLTRDGRVGPVAVVPSSDSDRASSPSEASASLPVVPVRCPGSSAAEIRPVWLAARGAMARRSASATSRRTRAKVVFGTLCRSISSVIVLSPE